MDKTFVHYDSLDQGFNKSLSTRKTQFQLHIVKTMSHQISLESTILLSLSDIVHVFTRGCFSLSSVNRLFNFKFICEKRWIIQRTSLALLISFGVSDIVHFILIGIVWDIEFRLPRLYWEAKPTILCWVYQLSLAQCQFA